MSGQERNRIALEREIAAERAIRIADNLENQNRILRRRCLMLTCYALVVLAAAVASSYHYQREMAKLRHEFPKAPTAERKTDVQQFKQDGTWEKPVGAKVVSVYCVGSGSIPGHVCIKYSANDLPQTVDILIGGGYKTSFGKITEALDGLGSGGGMVRVITYF